MKPLLTFALVVSLGLNATLAYFAISGSASSQADATAQAATTAAAETARRAKAGGPEPVDPKTWSSLSTTDLPDLVARLRAAGFPPSAIRAIVRALISDQFTERYRALDPEGDTRAFWKNQPPDNKLQLAQGRLYREQAKLLKELLGDEGNFNDAIYTAQQKQQYSYLPADKAAAILALIRANGEKQTELYYQKGTINQEEYRALESELQRNIAAALTPAEWEEYSVRSSNLARSLRNELMAFNPSEEEFRALVKIRLSMEQDLNPVSTSGFPSREAQQRQQDAEKRYLEQAEALLGPQRTEDLKRAQNYSYRQTAQLVARLELPPETTQTLWQVQQDFSKRRTEIARTYAPTPTPGVTPTMPEEYRRDLAALQEEAIAKVTPILGSASRVEAYKSYGGNWITSLVPQPRPPTPATGGK